MSEQGLPPLEPASASDLAEVNLREERIYSREFWLVFFASFALNSLGNLFVLFPLFIERRGASASTIGAIISVFSVAALASRTLVGAAIDRRGRKWVALRFLSLEALVMALYLPIHSLGWPIYAVRVIHGAVEGTARVALFAMVYDILPAGRRGEAMSTFSLCGMIPGALAPVVGEMMIRSYGFDAFFVAGIVLCAISAATAAMLPDDHPGLKPPSENNSNTPGYPSLVADGELLPLWIVTLLFASGISCRLSFVAPYAYQQGIQRVSLYFLIYSSVAAALRLFSAGLIDRLGLERALMPSLLVLGAGLALLSLTGDRGMLQLAALLGGIGHGYVYPALSALVIEHTDSTASGRSSSIYSSLYDLGVMIGPYSLGVAANHLGYAAMFDLSGGVVIVAAGYYLLARRTDRGLTAARNLSRL